MMQRQAGSRSSSSHNAPSWLSICRVIALRRGPLSIETMAICRSCRARRISMIWLPREDGLPYTGRRYIASAYPHRDQLAVIVNGTIGAGEGEGNEGDPLPRMGSARDVAAR